MSYHTLGTNIDTYFERMRASLGDKRRMFEYLTGSEILDIGCGSGELVGYLNSEGYSAHGVDPSAEAVAKSRNIGVDVLEGFADEADLLFGGETMDTILCSSVLHEVFSYGNRSGRRGKLDSLSDAFVSFYKTLRFGGRLIIRDGVMPEPGITSMAAPEAAVEQFLDASPFAREQAVDKDRSIALRHVVSLDSSPGMAVYEGTPSSVMEFAFTYTWGPESFEREVQEFYGVFTLDDYAYFAAEHGFRLVTSFAYTQPGYPKNLADKVVFQGSFPHSNALWVFEKQ